MLAAREPSSGCSPRGALQTYRARAGAALVRQSLTWIGGLLGVELRTAPDCYADLWLLGRVAEAVQAARRGEPRPLPPPRPPHRTFRQRIQDFLAFQQLCRDLGVRADLLPQLNDVEQGKGAAAVAACVQAVAEQCTALGLPVPHFGSDGSGLRCSMPRVMSARRAEAFSGKGPSPVKRPALGPLLTPRAYLGSPMGSARSAFRESNSRLGGWQRGGGEGADDARKAAHHQPGGQQEQVAPARSVLARTIAALERAAADSASLPGPGAGASSLRSPGFGSVHGTGAVLPPAPPQQQQQQQQWRRPVLPRLDIAAAAAQAAAEAAAQEEEEAAGDWRGSDGSSSPLSSPTSSLASPAGGYISSSSLLSSPMVSPSPGSTARTAGAAGAPSRHRITPTALLNAAHANPLWNTSPQGRTAPAAHADGGDDDGCGAAWRGRGTTSAAPSPLGFSGASFAGVQRGGARWRQGGEGEAGAAARDMREGSSATLPPSCSPAARLASPAPQPEGGQVQPDGSGSPVGSADVSSMHTSWDDGGGLLESLLCPPQLKPAHSRLLGALMHTSAGPMRPAQPTPAPTHAGEEEEQEQEDVAAQQAEEQVAPAPPAAAAADAPEAAAVQVAAAPSPSASNHGGMRRLALLVLGAAAGAAAAVAAGVVQQQRQDGAVRRRGSAAHRHPQRVPPLREGQRVVLAAAQAAVKQPAQQQELSGVSAAPAASWDNPDAIFTQG